MHVHAYIYTDAHGHMHIHGHMDPPTNTCICTHTCAHTHRELNDTSRYKLPVLGPCCFAETPPRFSLLYCYNGKEVIQMRQSAARCISGCVSSGPGHMIQPDAAGILLLLLLVHKRNLPWNCGAFKLELLINMPLK